MLKTKKIQPQRISIYWDSQNVYLTQERVKLLRIYANLKGLIIGIKVYYNSLREAQVVVKDESPIFGIKFVDVPCALKNSADNQLVFDVLEDMSSSQPPDIVILISGDGDFAHLVVMLKKLGVEVIVLAQRGNVKRILKEVAHEVHYVDELLQLSEEQNQRQNNAIESIITYNEAIGYLIAAIKTALNQGKQATLGKIDNVMRQLFPKYKGVACICNPDGGKFSRFSKFLEAVERDGKIKMHEQNLLLIE
ncbi:hypothetical protein WA1_08865 [Scytonema hofmannii PCC 7110]|uniref:NYN domain-containing protein n=1 Tax=Scytonema hofmannii PCC 7110 TaxID=128403 RepID=A0A139WS44_9CYAN|nr:NYN domain-containing protein [Scytonema hofmannii]KYC35256.1 hypothetical protein WA1_08865 [Scytonema hofmannii PCC 7110]